MARLPGNPVDLMDHLLVRDPVLQRLSKRLQRQQACLKRAVGLEHFRLYLLIEDTVNERCFALVERVWRRARAFERGRRRARRRVCG